MPSPATARVIAELRKTVPGVGPDRFLSPELEAATALINSGAVFNAAKEVVSTLI
jgi:histidine ammonia-lyase